MFRMIADHLRPGSLRTEPLLRNRVLEFVADTGKVLTASAAGVHRQSVHLARVSALGRHLGLLHTAFTAAVSV